ncbi:hypothetical protein F5887DRAFT_1193597 [Amanita rubescens]|nr:hypothetical protein F5887DRAFT_1193597 [Amanita rubescens]
MNTFLAFRTAVVSVLKRRLPTTLSRSQQQRSIFATSPFAIGEPRKAKTKFNKNSFLLTQAKKEEPRRKSDGPLKDEKITCRRVRIRHDGRLSELSSVSYILSLLDRRGYYIQLISHEPPIVKIVDKAEEYNRMKEEHEKAKLSKAKQGHKELQLSWATSDADIAHKLEKAKEDMAKGLRVNLVFTHKRGQPLPSLQDIHERLQRLVDSLAEVGKEWKPRVVQRRLAAVFLEGINRPNLGKGENLEAEDKEESEEDPSAPSKKRKYAINPIPEKIWDLFR